MNSRSIHAGMTKDYLNLLNDFRGISRCVRCGGGPWISMSERLGLVQNYVSEFIDVITPGNRPTN